MRTAFAICHVVVVCWATSSVADVEEGFEPLFDGQTLTGWTTADDTPAKVGWEVQDGVLVRTSGGGSILSEREFADFDLRFEWAVSRRGNSGVKYRLASYSPGIYSHREWLGYEYQIWDDAHRPGPRHTSAAAVYLLHAPNNDKLLKPTGEFNTARVVAVGPVIEHWLNGTKVVEVDTSSQIWWHRVEVTKFGEIDGIFQNRAGRIMLQDHGDKVWFRNIRIREIKDGSLGQQ